MATMSKHTNPINIAPFVDILLILFVILIVAARFNTVEDTTVAANKPQEIEKQKDKDIDVENLEEEIKKLSNENKELKQKKEKEASNLKKEFEKQSSTSKDIATLNKEVEELKKENKRLSKMGLNIEIDSYGGVYLISDGAKKKISPETVVDVVMATDSLIVKGNYAQTAESMNIQNYILRGINSSEIKK